MRRPHISIPHAVRVHYSTMELGTKDIAILFGCSPRTARVLKNEARVYQAGKGVPSYHPDRVNTRAAFEAWGLDIDEMEKDFYKLKKMGVLDECEDF